MSEKDKQKSISFLTLFSFCLFQFVFLLILKPELDNFEFTMEQSEVGYKNFTVIQCKIKSMEWLYLAAKGHRRAKFDLENNKDTWLVP